MLRKAAFEELADELMKRLDRYAAFGKELGITEFGINTSDEATQADYTRDFLGDYEIEVKTGSKTKTIHATLSKGGARIECVLD